MFSPGTGTVLILDSATKKGYIVDSRRGRVALHPSSDFKDAGDGETAKSVGTKPTQEVPLKTIDKRPAFSVDGTEYRVMSKPPLLGPRTSAEIAADDTYYGDAAKRYQPVVDYLADLKTYKKPTQVLVFFGSWCQNCHKWLPNIIRVENELKGTPIQFEYHGLPQGEADPRAQALNVKTVPFGVVFQDGKEIGRIAGPSWQFPDLQLHQLLIRSGK